MLQERVIPRTVAIRHVPDDFTAVQVYRGDRAVGRLEKRQPLRASNFTLGG
jgi:hypothetical protein